MRILVDADADINARNPYQRTPLHYTILNDQDAIIDALHRNKTFNVDAVDTKGETALRIAIR